MKSEKASNMRNTIYNMDVVKKNTTIESMQNNPPNKFVGCLRVKINKRSEGCRMKASMLSYEWNMGKFEPILSIYLPNYLSHTLQA